MDEKKNKAEIFDKVDETLEKREINPIALEDDELEVATGGALPSYMNDSEAAKDGRTYQILFDDVDAFAGCRFTCRCALSYKFAKTMTYEPYYYPGYSTFIYDDVKCYNCGEWQGFVIYSKKIK